LTVNGSCCHVYISATAFKSSKRVLRSYNLKYTNFSGKNPVKAIVITINYDLKRRIEDTKQYLLLMWPSICKRTLHGERFEPVKVTGAKTVT